VGGACSAYCGGESCVQVLGGKPMRKGLMGRPTLRWRYNIKADLQELDVDICIALSWLRIGTGGWHL
jgi:hypothetical protein